MTLRVFAVAALLALSATAHAQQINARAALAPEDSTQATPSHKSPLLAAGLGTVLPGAGHWYAGQRGRGAAVAAIYWTGVAMVAGGRTGRAGLVGGVALVGALGFSVVDGVHAAKRANNRMRAVRQMPTQIAPWPDRQLARSRLLYGSRYSIVTSLIVDDSSSISPARK